MRNRLTAVAALALLALLAAGCGVPLSKSAVLLPKSLRVQAQPGAVSTSTTTTTLPASTKPSPQLTVYLVGPQGHLVGVRRNAEKTPENVLDVLAIGPEADEKQLSASLPASASMRVTIGRRGIAKVILDEASFAGLYGSSLYVALAAVVYTLMVNFPVIKGVDFYLREGGEDLKFNYTPAGTAVREPVTLATYAALAPLPVRTTKTTKTTKPANGARSANKSHLP